MFPSRYPPQVHLFPHNPYPPLPPPQPIAHKVWIIDCKSCGTFLTNRGMKAVLLLHPNVGLYSSDALPVNCSAYTTNPDVLRPATSCRPPARTCECLTQTLCCHGCGAIVGYMIVIPCTRCTSSITATNRATNGHRFVFHSSEVVGSERHYISDEPGVVPFDLTLISVSPSGSPNTVFSPSSSPPPLVPIHDMYSSRSQASSAAPSNEYLPTPPVDIADLSPASSTTPSPITGSFPFSGHQSSSLGHSQSDDSIRQFMYRHSNFASPDLSSPPPPSVMSQYTFGVPSEPLEWGSVKLKGGDVLYWHHLVRHGEIPGVADDPRSRKPPTQSGPVKIPYNR